MQRLNILTSLVCEVLLFVRTQQVSWTAGPQCFVVFIRNQLFSSQTENTMKEINRQMRTFAAFKCYTFMQVWDF